MQRTYEITEIFLTIQGEGFNAGKPYVFIRFANCSVGCSFCDTDYSVRETLTAREIAERVRMIWGPGGSVPMILTGGEPLQQYDRELHEHLAWMGTLTLETSGAYRPRFKFDYVCCSPKVGPEILIRNFPGGVDELRYIIHKQRYPPIPPIKATHYYLSPMFDGEKPKPECMENAVSLVQRNPPWRLSLPLHKFGGFR